MRTYQEIISEFNSKGIQMDLLSVEKVEVDLCRHGSSRTTNQRVANHFSDLGMDVYEEKDIFGTSVYCIEIPESEVY